MAKTPGWWRRPPGLAAAALAPAALLYRSGARLRAALCRPYRASVPVICVGNALVGGGGKTPSAIFIARLLQAEGKRAMFVSKGYKGKITRTTAVDPDMHDAAAVGDEPLLLAQAAPAYIGKNRLKAIKAAERLEPDAIIMDDGLQNPTIYKDLTILAESPAYAPANDRLFPSGPYRESRAEAAGRADMILSLHYGAELPSMPGGEGDKTVALRITADARGFDMGVPCIAFAGLGEPQKFFDTLRGEGFQIVETIAFPDHHPYSEKDISALLAKAASATAILLTTEKDWVRLPKARKRYVRFLPISAVASEGGRETLRAALLRALDKGAS